MKGNPNRIAGWINQVKASIGNEETRSTLLHTPCGDSRTLAVISM